MKSFNMTATLSLSLVLASPACTERFGNIGDNGGAANTDAVGGGTGVLGVGGSNSVNEGTMAVGGSISTTGEPTMAVGGSISTTGEPTMAVGGAPSSGGDFIFFDSLRNLNRDVYAIRPDGTGLWRVTDSSATDQDPAVSPDGQTLAFASDRDGGFQIYLMALPAGEAVKVGNISPGAKQPAWSPDGTQLAFHRDPNVYVMDVDGSNERLIIQGMGTMNAYAHPIFEPSGASLLVDRYNQIEEVSLIDGTKRSVLLSTTTAVEHPTISPDGHSVVFSAMCDSGTYSLWLVPLAAATDPCRGGTRLGVGHYPAFGADGTLAYENGQNPSKIALMRPDGTTFTLTSGSFDDRNPRWATLE